MSTKHTNHDKDHGIKKEDAVFSCSSCDKKFDSLEELSDHRKKTHDPLERIKDDIINEVEHEFEKHDKKGMVWGSTLVTVVLVILTIVSVVQTAQSASILKKIESEDFKAGGSAGGSALPSSLDQLPGMVGGC